MMDMMVLFLELVATMIIMVTKPFSLVKLSCIFGAKSICIVIDTWMELLRAAICFHVYIVWRLTMWTCALISLPARVLTALQRERLLEMHLHEVRDELETLVWETKELEERLQVAIKERTMLEVMLAEVEEEHDQAIGRIELLEGELQDLKEENHRLKEVEGKTCWSSGVNTGVGYFTKDADKYGNPHGVPTQRSIYPESGTNLEGLLQQKDGWEDEDRGNTQTHDLAKTGPHSSVHLLPLLPDAVSRNLDVNEVLDRRRELALSQSLFSALLSLLVGIIIWQADDPCMPLVVALFSVVGMSLISAVQFFSTIKNKPASDVVALLSFNWFMLGTLTYPTLPRVACMFTPLAFNIFGRIVRWLDFS